MTGELASSLVGSGDELWVVGKVTNVLSDGWDFIGVFSDESFALSGVESVCLQLNDEDKRGYFVAPARLDEPLACADGSDWVGGYFPYKDSCA